MRKKTKAIFSVVALIVTAIVILLILYFHHHVVAIFDPAGQVGYRERSLMFFTLILSAIVVIPTFSIAVFIVWKYRENNHRPKKYKPDFDHSRLFESIWWGIPIIIIAVLAVTAWESSHTLDPYRPLVSAQRPLAVQVVALDWKWLFIYPRQQIASVNLLEMPVNTPVSFNLTSDSVMNSFWIPQLGGQIYEMPGMSTKLQLEASRTGTFYGSPANISGEGFSRMIFSAKAVSQRQFNHWVGTVSKSPNSLTLAAYRKLAEHNESPVKYYSGVQSDLYAYEVMKYMSPQLTIQNVAAIMDGNKIPPSNVIQNKQTPKNSMAGMQM